MKLCSCSAQLVIATSLICVEIIAVVASILWVPPVPMLYYPSVTRVKLVIQYYSIRAY